jgi:SMC interacting uncharacterized protein involved in chromosome segregation
MLNNFSAAKDELTRKLSAANATLDEERAKHEKEVESLENRFLVEREKMRRVYEAKHESAKRELESTVDKKLSGKVRKTQVMNVLIRKELESQSKHAEKLLEINESIVDRDRDLKRDLQLARGLQEEMATKLAAYQRTVRQLNEKLAVSEADLQRQQADFQEELRAQVMSMLHSFIQSFIHSIIGLLVSREKKARRCSRK